MKLSPEQCRLIIENLKLNEKITDCEYHQLRWCTTHETELVKFCKKLYEIYQNRLRYFLGITRVLLAIKILETEKVEPRIANAIADNISIHYVYLCLIKDNPESALLLSLMVNLSEIADEIPLGFTSIVSALIDKNLAITDEMLKSELSSLAVIQMAVFETLIPSWMLYQDLGVEHFLNFVETTDNSLVPGFLVLCFRAHATIINKQDKVNKTDLGMVESKEAKQEILLLNEHSAEIEMLLNLYLFLLQIFREKYVIYLQSANPTPLLKSHITELLTPVINDVKYDLMKEEDASAYFECIVHLYLMNMESQDNRMRWISKILGLIGSYHHTYGESLLKPALVFINIGKKPNVSLIKAQVAEEINEQRLMFQADLQQYAENLQQNNEVLTERLQENIQFKQQISEFYSDKRKAEILDHAVTRDQINRGYSRRFYAGIGVGAHTKTGNNLAFNVDGITFAKQGKKMLDANILFDRLTKPSC